METKVWGVYIGLAIAFAFADPAQAVDYFQVSTGKYRVNYRADSASISVTEFRYGTYLSRSFSLEADLSVGSSSDTMLKHGSTYLDPSYTLPTQINWLGRPSDFSSADVDMKLNNIIGVFASYRWIVRSFDFAARAGLVQASYNATFHARDAIINGVQIKTYKEEIGGADFGVALGLSALAMVSENGSVVLEWQLQPRVGDSVRNGDHTKVSANAVQFGVRFIF